MTAARPLIRRYFLDARIRTISFAYIFGVYAWLQAAGYHSAYPTVADRQAFARTFAGNDAIRLFYGYPYDVLTVGGYSAWRVGGTLALAAAAFGVLASVRAMRAEEDEGRAEVVLAGPVGRRTVFLSALAAIAAGTAVLWLAELAGFVVGGLPLAGSAYLALGTVSVVPVFAGIGAFVGQLAPNRRMALGLGGGTVAVFWLLRILADTIAGGAWLRWATPLGWAEELRPFAGARPLVLLAPAALSVLLLALSGALAAARDVGTGLVAARDARAPSTVLLSSPTALALRRQGGVLAVWAAGFAVFAAILGGVSSSVSSAGISANQERDLARLGSGPVTTPTGYLSFVFIVFVFAACLFVCAQVASVREEEAGQTLETLLALPVSRYRWLAGRLAVATVAVAVLSGLSGLLTWAGAASEHVDVPLPRLLEAAANCLPVSVMFLGIAAVVYAVAPRASSAVSYSLVSVAFLWYLVGSLLGVPRWLVDVTPFEHIGLVPAQPFRVVSAAAMVAVGVAGALAALGLFRRRDLLGA